MNGQIALGDIIVDVVRKDIKNVHLSIYPPAGRVRIAAPRHMSADTLRAFAISKLEWIKKQQKKFQDQERETAREYLERESHYVWGTRYLLTISEVNQPPQVELSHTHMVLTVRPDTDVYKRQAIVENWYRKQLKVAAPAIIKRWEPLMGVQVKRFMVRRMKTKWGSCTPATGSIRLNTELAKKPRDCLEYVIVHEMVHLLEPTHNKHFVSLMDHFMPQWQLYRAELNRLPMWYE